MQQVRTIPIQERSVRVGDVIVVNGYRVNRSSFTARFAEGCYQVHETQLFLLFTRAEDAVTVRRPRAHKVLISKVTTFFHVVAVNSG